MPLPFVIDNQQHGMADILSELLVQTAGKPLDIATAYFAISEYRLDVSVDGIDNNLVKLTCWGGGHGGPVPQGRGESLPPKSTSRSAPGFPATLRHPWPVRRTSPSGRGQRRAIPAS